MNAFRMVLRRSLLAALMLLCAGPAQAAAADASGTLTYHGQTFELKFAYAFRHPYVFDRSKQALTLALADRPFDKAKLDASPLRESELDNVLCATGTNMIKLMLAPTGEDSIIEWQAARKKRGTVLIAYQFELQQNDDIRILGTLRSKNAADGGAPGKAYLAYNAALWRSDLNALANSDKQTSAWIQQHREDKNFPKSFALLRDMQALRDLKIKSALVKSGEKATLVVAGKDTAGGDCENTVIMSKKDGAWGIERLQPHHSQ